MDWSSASDADRVPERGDGVQWPKERKPMDFIVGPERIVAGYIGDGTGLGDTCRLRARASLVRLHRTMEDAAAVILGGTSGPLLREAHCPVVALPRGAGTSFADLFEVRSATVA